MSASAQHHDFDLPSPWVCRFAPLIRRGGLALDLACGAGRHARYLAGLGYRVEAVDRDAGALRALATVAGVIPRNADLECGSWPYSGRQFDAIVVTHYLHRPLLPCLLAALADGGVLIYETFAAGNERYGRPRNPDFLLRRGELLEFARGRLQVVAYEDLHVEVPRPAMIQRLCAIKLSAGV
jgi:SAM-dependent methyltransferase